MTARKNQRQTHSDSADSTSWISVLSHHRNLDILDDGDTIGQLDHVGNSGIRCSKNRSRESPGDPRNQIVHFLDLFGFQRRRWRFTKDGTSPCYGKIHSISMTIFHSEMQQITRGYFDLYWIAIIYVLKMVMFNGCVESPDHEPSPEAAQHCGLLSTKSVSAFHFWLWFPPPQCLIAGWWFGTWLLFSHI